MRGPIDYIIVGFDKPNFDGSVIAELQKAVEAGVISVLALVVVHKDQEGNVTSFSADEAGDVEITFVDKSAADMVTEDDILEVGDLLDNDSAAGLLIVEHLWAKGLKSAILGANGSLIADGRIHPEAYVELTSKGE